MRIAFFIFFVSRSRCALIRKRFRKTRRRQRLHLISSMIRMKLAVSHQRNPNSFTHFQPSLESKGKRKNQDTTKLLEKMWWRNYSVEIREISEKNMQTWMLWYGLLGRASDGWWHVRVFFVDIIFQGVCWHIRVL